MLGPSGSAHCRVCGLKVGVDVAKAIVALIPASLILVIPVLGLIIQPVLLMLPFIGCLVLSAGLYLFWLPLRLDEFSSPSEVAASRERINRARRS